MTQTVKPGTRASVCSVWSGSIQPWSTWAPTTTLEPDTMGRTDDFEMISITVSDSSPRQYDLMLLETDKLSRVTLMAVGTNQNRFTASAAPQRRYALPNPSANPLPSATFSNCG